MFYKLGKFDGPVFPGGGLYTGGAYIRDVNWVLYLEGRIFGREWLIYAGRINGILQLTVYQIERYNG